MVTVWSKRARMELHLAYEYILQDSPQNAVKVRNEIIETTIKLSEHPEKHPPDKYKKSNDGNWRAFEIYHFRVTYRVMQNEIRIVRMRQTSRTPINF
jgi:plasmid stabilization system protein ParE